MKRLGVFLFPLDGMLVHRRVSPGIKFAGTHSYTWVERGTMTVKCLVQEHSTIPLGLEPRLLNPESSTLTIGPPRLHTSQQYYYNRYDSSHKLYLLNMITSYTSLAIFPPFPLWQSVDRPYLLYVSCAVKLERQRPPS